MLLIWSAAVHSAVGASQLVYPQTGESGGESQQNYGIGGAHGCLDTMPVVFVCHPLLYFNLSFLDLFVVHAGMDAGWALSGQKRLDNGILVANAPKYESFGVLCCFF